MEDIDLAYIAGLFDGEGCFHLGHKTERGMQAMVTMVICDPELLGWVADTTGLGSAWIPGRKTKKGRVYGQYSVTGNDTIKEFLELILPYLRTKLLEAELLLEYVTNHKRLSSKGTKGITSRELEIFHELKLLKTKSV